MLKEIFSEDRILDDLRSDDESRINKALRILYKRHYSLALNIIKRRGGTENETADIYQESIIAFYESVRNDKYRGDAKISTWLHSTISNKWSVEIRQTRRFKTDHIEDSTKELRHEKDEGYRDNSELMELVWKTLDLIDEKCKQVLIDYYYNRLSMKEIMTKMGFKSEQVAKNKRYRCKDRLDEIIAERPGLKKHLNQLYYERF
ncbi:MAG: sigma-70 family RNA polymerase sigma factor [Bacteroidales bacterium]|nr:sigma-70 family RNA polymerase sigma factor [Bacteroidales bacterium]MCF8456087.1 sigma-70 family RNA polymerase sigma factor [Bacteroidales bacterium]